MPWWRQGPVGRDSGGGAAGEGAGDPPTLSLSGYPENWIKMQMTEEAPEE